MKIPWQSLSEEALIGLIEEFVLREGTEYGLTDVPLEEKVQQTMAQLDNGSVAIFYDPLLQSTTLDPVDKD